MAPAGGSAPDRPDIETLALGLAVHRPGRQENGLGAVRAKSGVNILPCRIAAIRRNRPRLSMTACLDRFYDGKRFALAARLHPQRVRPLRRQGQPEYAAIGNGAWLEHCCLDHRGGRTGCRHGKQDRDRRHVLLHRTLCMFANANLAQLARRFSGKLDAYTSTAVERPVGKTSFLLHPVTFLRIMTSLFLSRSLLCKFPS